MTKTDASGLTQLGPIDIFWQTGAPPDGVWIPDQGVAPYRGRD